MQDKKNFKNPKLDDFANFKSLMSLNESLMEATKSAIKGKNNDIAFKMMENLGERPELWHEYLSIAIINQNFGFAKQLIEKFQIDVRQIPNLNAGTMNSEILQESQGMVKLTKAADNKENFLTVECPLLIQAAIGGDLDIFKFLVDRGAPLNSHGHITLSRKNKNSVISNVLGASAYFGRVVLVHFILEKYDVEINAKCIEKKSKIKQFTLNKEFSDFTPVHLVIASEFCSEDDSIEILKLLYKYLANFNLVDCAKNNILHLAAKYNKPKIVKFIIEDLKLGSLLNDLNKEGQTPIAIAQDHHHIVDYLLSYNGSDNKIEEELNELIEESTSKAKKGKKSKKKKNMKDDLIVGSEWQEVLKAPKPQPQKLVFEDDTKKQVPKEESVEEAEENEEEKVSDDKGKNVHAQPAHTYERRSYNTDKNYNYKSYNRNQEANTDYYNYNYKKGYYNRNEGDSYYNRNYNTAGSRRYNKGKEEFVSTETVIEVELNPNVNVNMTSTNIKEKEKVEDIKDVNVPLANVNAIPVVQNSLTEVVSKPKTTLIGLGSKPKKQKKEKKEIMTEVFTDKIKIENTAKVSIEKVEVSLPPITTTAEPLVEQVKETEEYENEEEDFLQENEEEKVQHKDSVSVSKADEPLEIEINPHDQETFISEKETSNLKEENLTSTEQQKLPSESSLLGLKEITSKYLLMEQQYEKERKEKFEIEKYILSQKKVGNSTLRKCHVVNNSEDNIQDLISIANEELERKSKAIADLQARIEYLEGKNLERLDENQLNQLSSFYGARLSSIVAAINNLNNKHK